MTENVRSVLRVKKGVICKGEINMVRPKEEQ